MQDAMELSIHAASLNFNDVLDVILPDETAYGGRDTPPLRWSGDVNSELCQPRGGIQVLCGGQVGWSLIWFKI